MIELLALGAEVQPLSRCTVPTLAARDSCPLPLRTITLQSLIHPLGPPQAEVRVLAPEPQVPQLGLDPTLYDPRPGPNFLRLAVNQIGIVHGAVFDTESLAQHGLSLHQRCNIYSAPD